LVTVTTTALPMVRVEAEEAEIETVTPAALLASAPVDPTPRKSRKARSTAAA